MKNKLAPSERFRRGSGRLLIGGFRRDIWRRLAALLLAMLIYGVVKEKYFSGEARFSVAVDIAMPAGVCNTAKTVPHTDVLLKGGKSALTELSPSELKIRGALDASMFVEGEPCRIKLRDEWLSLPPGIRLEKFEPDVISLDHLEPEIEKRVPVAAAWNEAGGGRAYREFSRSAEFTPSSVIVTGPKSIVGSISEIRTEILTVPPNETGDFYKERVALILPGDVSVSTREVEARIKITRNSVTRKFHDIPVLILDDRVGYGRNIEFISANRSDLEIRGPQQDLDAIVPAQLRPCVDVSMLDEPGEYDVDVQCRTPDGTGCRIEKIYPPKLKIRLSEPGGSAK